MLKRIHAPLGWAVVAHTLPLWSMDGWLVSSVTCQIQLVQTALPGMVFQSADDATAAVRQQSQLCWSLFRQYPATSCAIAYMLLKLEVSGCTAPAAV